MRLDFHFKCPIDWSTSPSDVKTRHCDHCQKTVHSAEHLNDSEIESLIQTGQACMDFKINRKGQIITQSGLSKTLMLGSALTIACWQEQTPPAEPPTPPQTEMDTETVTKTEAPPQPTKKDAPPALEHTDCDSPEQAQTAQEGGIEDQATVLSGINQDFIGLAGGLRAPELPEENGGLKSSSDHTQEDLPSQE